jgi:hypothetical protein
MKRNFCPASHSPCWPAARCRSAAITLTRSEIAERAHHRRETDARRILKGMEDSTSAVRMSDSDDSTTVELA